MSDGFDGEDGALKFLLGLRPVFGQRIGGHEPEIHPVPHLLDYLNSSTRSSKSSRRRRSCTSVGSRSTQASQPAARLPNHEPRTPALPAKANLPSTLLISYVASLSRAPRYFEISLPPSLFNLGTWACALVRSCRELTHLRRAESSLPRTIPNSRRCKPSHSC